MKRPRDKRKSRAQGGITSSGRLSTATNRENAKRWSGRGRQGLDGDRPERSIDLPVLGPTQARAHSPTPMHTLPVLGPIQARAHTLLVLGPTQARVHSPGHWSHLSPCTLSLSLVPPKPMHTLLVLGLRLTIQALEPRSYVSELWCEG